VLTRDQVFMDIDSIAPGEDFVEILEDWVERCDVMLVLIGVNWLNTIDPVSKLRRLDNPDDFVRIEVRKGLERSIPVIPLLLDGATMPNVSSLPDDLKALVRRQAEIIEHRTVDTDVQRLIKKINLKAGHRSGTASTQSPPDLTPVRRSEPSVGSVAPVEFRSGIVKFYNGVKGYGFITDRASGKDIFVHITALERCGVKMLTEGQAVGIVIENDRRTGKDQVSQIRL
jgi:cold shock CspA family protein